MNRDRLRALLDAEVARWASKSLDELVEALPDVTACQRGAGADYHQFEVQLIEKNPDYVHVIISADDGSFRRSFAPVTRSFIVHRDGRVEL